MRTRPLLLVAGLLAATAAPRTSAQDRRYLEDFEFVVDTVARNGAAVQVRDIDWKAAAARLRPQFAACTSDLEHVKHVMELLAVLGDGHTGVTRSSVQGLPSKFDGLYGGGLWISAEDGRFLVRGVLPGHALESTLPLGSMILALDRQPMWWVMAREEKRITRYAGISSRHSLYASLGNRMLPFGDAKTLEMLVLTPEGKVKKVSVPRWGPGGKAFSPLVATLPDGVAPGDGAVSTLLALPWCGKVGYLRITGGMNAATVQAFHAAFDALLGMEALLLDCRGMGGGSDDAAWEMMGRLLPRGADNGRNGRIDPAGTWQFDGPVVMLQDEMEVSSAETFTWAACETGRVLSVGRPTGGWAIIPRGFDCPSGLVSFRLGVGDRPTPIRGLHTEGTGWPPDVTVPLGPRFAARPDPVREVGLACLELLHAGLGREDVARLFQGLFDGDVRGFGRAAETVRRKAEDFDPAPLADLVQDDLETLVAMEVEALRCRDVAAPDVLASARRLDEVRERARAAGVGTLADWEREVKEAKKEAAAQEALLACVDETGAASDKDRKSWLAKHKKTATGRWVADEVWKRSP